MTGTFGDVGLTWGDPLAGFGGVGVLAPAPVGFTIEIGFTDGTLVASPAWTDVTPWVRSFSTRRGRNHELGKTSTGTAAVVLDNRDRRFDPTYTSGPYYPNVLPMRHIRVRAILDGVTIYDIFRGFIEDWGQRWGGPAAAAKGDATVEIAAADAFKVLQLMRTNPYRGAVLADSPALYFPMDDPVGTGFGVNLGDGGEGADFLTYDPTNEGLVTLAARTDGPFASTALQPAPDFRNPSTLGAPVYLPAAEVTLSQSPLTIEFWSKPDTLTGTPNYIVAQGGDYWRVTTSGQVTFEYISNREHGVGWTSVTSTASLTPTGQMHHVAVVRDIDTVAFYQDGVLMETFGGLGDPFAIPPSVFGLYKIGASFDGVLAHLAIYPSALTADQINTHYAATCDVITAQPSGAAIGAILNCVGWPAGLRDIDAGMSTVTLTPSGSALDGIQQIGEDTEHGILEVTPDGKLTFIGRDVLEIPTTALATFGDGGGSEIPYGDLALAYDDQDLWTEVEVSDAAGDTFVADDGAAIALYGRRTLSVSTVAATANEAQAQSTGLLNRYKAPAVRPTSITFMGPRSADQQVQRAVGDRVTLKRRPPGTTSGSVWIVLATDSFNRANGALAGTLTETGSLTYTNWLGTGSAISSNQFVSPASGALLDTGVTDHALEMTPSPTGTTLTLNARVVALTHWLQVQWSGTTVTLSKTVSGASTTVGTYAAGARDRTRLAVVGDAVTVSVGGVVRISYTITDAVLRTSSSVGILAYSGGDWWDDLQIDRWGTVDTALTVDAFIEGVNHDVGPDGWLITTFSLAPPDPGAFWFLEDAVRSVLGSTTFPGW